MTHAVDQALRTVPLGPFIQGPPPADDSVPASIGGGQRATPPDTVLRLVLVARIAPGLTVLEIGSGTGFMAAVFAAMGARVHGIERHAQLVQAASEALRTVGSSAVLHHGDGQDGWPEYAPYDVIVSSVALPRLPPTWLRQLGPTGRLVAPIGAPGATQELTVWQRVDGQLHRTGRGPARFAALSSGVTGLEPLDRLD